MKTVYGKIHSQNVSRIHFPNKESLSCMLKKDTSVFLFHLNKMVVTQSGQNKTDNR